MHACEPGAERVRRCKPAVARHMFRYPVGRVARALAEPEANERAVRRKIATVKLANDPNRAAPRDLRRRDTRLVA